MKTAIATKLSGDATLMAILLGGIHTTSEISRQGTPTAFDSTTKELLPCGLVKLSTSVPSGGLPNTERLTVRIWLYQRTGFDSIEPAARRIYALLHKVRLAPSDGAVGVWEILHADDVPNSEDAVLDASLFISRFYVHYRR